MAVLWDPSAALAETLTVARKLPARPNCAWSARSAGLENFTRSFALVSGSSWRERRRLLTLRRPDPTVIWARAVQVAWQTADIRSEPARESRLRGRLNLISGLSGEPWQRSVPESLKVLPATGTNRQS